MTETKDVTGAISVVPEAGGGWLVRRMNANGTRSTRRLGDDVTKAEAEAFVRGVAWGSASPVPAAEHQADMARRQAYYAGLQGDPALRPQSSADIASHWPQAPAVRYVEPHREAFIALYEAANTLLGALDIDCDTRALASIDNPCRALQGALDKAAPAYGQALVARAEAREPVAHQLSDRSPIGQAMLLGQGPVITFPAEKARVLTAARKYLEHWEDCEGVPDPEELPFELEIYNAASALRAAETDEMVAKETGGQ